MDDAALGNKSAKELAAYIERIESLNAELAELKDNIKAEYALAGGDGFEKKALKQIIKERAADAEKTVQHRATVETYRRALGGLSGTPLGDWARGWLADDARNTRHAQEAASVMDDFMARAKAKKTEGGAE